MKPIIKWVYRSLASRLKSNYSDSDRDECWAVVEIYEFRHFIKGREFRLLPE